MKRTSFEDADCPVARSLDSIGDWWSLLIVRDVLAGKRRFGGLDVVFSNAGISGAIAPITEYPTEVFRRVLDVHVLGAFHLLKHAFPHLSLIHI